MTQNDNRTTRPSLFRLLWPLFLALGLLLLRWLIPAAIIEAVYSRGLFPVLRYAWDYTLPLLPIPLFFVFWLLVVFWLARALVQWKGVKKRESTGAAFKFLGRRLLNGISLLIGLFLLVWGFNYGRLPVDEALGFSRYQPTQEELRERVYQEAAELATLRSTLTADTSALPATLQGTDLEAQIRPLIKAALARHGLPTPGRPRARQLVPQGLLLKWSTAGVYWPWAGEANIDSGLHHLQKPAVMAHEFAHAYGYGDEGTCTFWAWLAGREATEAYLKYAFKLAYWRQMAGRLRRAEPQRYTDWRAANLAPGIRNDLQSIYDNSAQYKDIAPVVRDVTYDAFLRTQGVHGGLANYGTVIQLVEGYRRTE